MSEVIIAKESAIEAKESAIEAKESAIEAKVAIEAKEDIHPAIQYIYDSCKQFMAINPKRLNFDIEIPVKKIDGIQVEIFLRFKLYSIDCYLCVHSYMICNNGDNNEDNNEDNNLRTYFKENLLYTYGNSLTLTESKLIEYTIDNITEIYNKCNAILPKLQFNRLTGEMYKNDIDAKGLQFGLLKLKGLEAWTSDLENNDNLDVMYKTCPVCFEITKTRTNCKHPLCIVCWEGICWANSLADTHICPTCKEELNDHSHILDRIFRERDSDSGDEGDEDDEDDEEDENWVCEDCKGNDCKGDDCNARNGENCNARNSEDCNGEA